MATTTKTKVALEVLFVRAELNGIPEKALLKSRNMVQVDMIWPRSGVATKSPRGGGFRGRPKAKTVSERSLRHFRMGLKIFFSQCFQGARENLG